MKEVYKFWGTSVDYLEQIAIIILNKKKTNLPHVCVSAFSWITDNLLDLIDDAKTWKDINNWIEKIKLIHFEKLESWIKTKQLIEPLKKTFENFYDKKIVEIKKHLLSISKSGVEVKDFDPIIWFWEQISAFLLSEIISLLWKSTEIKWRFVDLWKLVTYNFKNADKVFLEAVRNEIAKVIIEDWHDNQIPIITWFIWKVPWWILNWIDRWYTDFTSAIVASVISAKKLIIFKEVDGICSADPRIVWNECILLKHLSYTEVLKMASSWMKAINTEAVKPAMADNIPIEVRNTLYPDNEGTLITDSRKINPNVKIQTIPSKKWVSIVRFWSYNDWLMWENLWVKLSQMIKSHRVKRYFSTSDEAWFSVVVKQESEKISALADDLKAYATVKINNNCAIVWIVWEEMKWAIWTFALAANAISDQNINIHMVSQWASEISIAFVIDEQESKKAIKALHKAFFEKK